MVGKVAKKGPAKPTKEVGSKIGSKKPALVAKGRGNSEWPSLYDRERKPKTRPPKR